MRLILSLDLAKQSESAEFLTLDTQYTLQYLTNESDSLAQLLYRSFKDSLDDQGETLEEWQTEVTATMNNKYGEIITAFSFNLYHEELLIGTLITASFREVPLILYIAIHPDYQGQGLAKILLHYLIKQAQQVQSHQQLFLVVAANNVPAYKLYKKIGFTERGTNWDAIL